MGKKDSADQLSVEELTQLLYQRKRVLRRQRLERMKFSGRLVEMPRPPVPNLPQLPESNKSVAADGNLRTLEACELGSVDRSAMVGAGSRLPGIRWRWIGSKAFSLVEFAAVIGFVAVLVSLWRTSVELNREVVQIQRIESQTLALPTPSATPLIRVVILPGGHRPPVDGTLPEPGEAGYIPAHLLPAVNAFVPPPIPTPAVEQARRIQIPAIDVDSPIVQGMYDWEQLKKGVAQKIGSAVPGKMGNMVLAGHNDIYGEVFRHLDRLSPGDEIIVSTQRQSYTYKVRATEIVEPTEVGVMKPTDFASATLISCYPYRINTQRIIIFADLVDRT